MNPHNSRTSSRTLTLRRRLTRALSAVLVVCLVLSLAACRPKNAGPNLAPQTNPVEPAPPTLPVAGKVGPPDTGAYIGVFRPPAPFDISKLDSYSAISNKPPAILMWYQAWAQDAAHEFDAATCVSAFQRGAIPMITWEPWDPSQNIRVQPNFRLANIANGAYDEYIRSWARGIKSVGGPVMLRPLHEMNGNWYPWCGTVNGNSPALFVAAWRHMHDVFEQEGVKNVTWVWSINGESIPRSPANSYAAYYPGDAYVDWTGISGFNWGTSRPTFHWKTFDAIYRMPLAYLDSLGKPIVLAEFSSVANGGDKAAWITDAYQRVKVEHPTVKAVVFYDSREHGPKGIQDWSISSSAASAKAYERAVSVPYFIGGPAPPLSVWLDKLDQRDWLYLQGLPPVY